MEQASLGSTKQNVDRKVGDIIILKGNQKSEYVQTGHYWDIALDNLKDGDQIIEVEIKSIKNAKVTLE